MRHPRSRVLLGGLIVALLLAGARPGITMAADGWDFSNDAWAYLRAKTPTGRNVYRPTWLPERFRAPASAQTVGLLFGAGYDSDAGDRLFFGTPANFCGGNGGMSEPITVRGYLGTLFTGTDCAPEIWFSWQEGEQWYLVMGYRYRGASAPSRAEMLRIAASLEPVGADGRPTAPGGPPAEECFAETGQCVAGRFLDRWRATGGATINGFPLTGEFAERLEDGKSYTVQYFERVRLESHPEHPAPYDVLLGQFGRRIRPVDPPVAPDPNAPQYFPETGHNLSGLFFNYWREHGLAQFGYPLTEEITETLEDGKQYRVQYFERARLEYHPENPYPYQILLGQFGRRILSEGLRPADSQLPAAGVCSAAQGAVATVRVNGDTPAPRCQVVRPEQHLRVVNATGQPVRVQLAQIDATIPPGGEQTFARSFGSYLAPGVHRLALSAYAGGGAELWLRE